MYTISQLLCEMEACVSRLKSLGAENKLADFPYELGRLAAYNQLLYEFVTSNKTESPGAKSPSG